MFLFFTFLIYNLYIFAWLPDAYILCCLFFSGISVNITTGIGMLTISTVVPVIFKEKTYGLLGSFNDNPDDDFIPREETTPLPANITDRQIFDFGKTCKNIYLSTCKSHKRNGVSRSKA